MNDIYDVAILGGGLAGLALSLQLQLRRPGTRVVVLERNRFPAPDAAFKVGESTVELSTHYFREQLGLRDYLDAEQLPKVGLRFYLSSQHGDDIARRVEIGPRDFLPVPSHQLDRGRFENELAVRCRAAGNELIEGVKVTAVRIDRKARHEVDVRGEEGTRTLRARWVVDASGRAAVLKRTLGLEADTGHTNNATWFRLEGDIDIDAWSEDPAWRARSRPGLRRLGTVHLMGRGYWVWLIALVSGHTSVGIVVDSDEHPVAGLNRWDRVLDWLRRHEPQCAAAIEAMGREPEDFRVLRRYSHHCERVYSPERWAITGDAGAFLDPLYSPGSDFIAIGNSFITDLVCSDLDGERTGPRAEHYNRMYLGMIDTWLPTFRGRYAIMGNTQIMAAKVVWDFSLYWAAHVFTFANDGFRRLEVVAALREEWRLVRELNDAVQERLSRWAERPAPPLSDGFLDLMEVGFLGGLHRRMIDRCAEDEFPERFRANVRLLAALALELVRALGDPAEETDPGLGVLAADQLPGDALRAEVRGDLRGLWFGGDQAART